MERFDLLHHDLHYDIEYWEINGSNGTRFLKIQLNGKLVTSASFMSAREFAAEVEEMRKAS